jgi:hypothetical protein
MSRSFHLDAQSPCRASASLVLRVSDAPLFYSGLKRSSKPGIRLWKGGRLYAQCNEVHPRVGLDGQVPPTLHKTNSSRRPERRATSRDSCNSLAQAGFEQETSVKLYPNE